MKHCRIVGNVDISLRVRIDRNRSRNVELSASPDVAGGPNEPVPANRVKMPPDPPVASASADAGTQRTATNAVASANPTR
jgi:hypothetical protein